MKVRREKMATLTPGEREDAQDEDAEKLGCNY